MSHFADGQGEIEVSGLARDIRTTITSEQFDLGGYTEQRAKDLIHAAFSSPLTAPNEMIRITFVVGGGKLVRSRYPEDLPKWMVAALREIGFTEDRSAAETFDSQGTFKQQHDTGQNLKYLIVYPHVACAHAKGGAPDEKRSSASLDGSSPEFITLTSDFSTFQEIVASNVHSYHQKKKLLKFLQQKHEEYLAIEQKLVSGERLSPNEQEFYDKNSGADQEKLNFLQSQIKEMVDNSQITNKEKVELIKSIDQNINTSKQEIDAAKAENKPKKLEKLQSKLESMQTRKSFVEKITPIAPRLLHGDEIRQLYMRLIPLFALEDKERSMSLTMADLKLLEEKADLEKAIRVLQDQSRGWFEDEEDHQDRCQFEESEAKRIYKHRQSEKKNRSSGNPGSAANQMRSWIAAPTGKPASSSNAWTTVGKKPSTTTSSSHTAATKKATTAYSAFDESDSDD